PDHVSRDTMLGNPNAKDIRSVAMTNVPKEVFDGGYQKVLAWFNSQSPDPEDHTDSVWLSDGGKLTYHRAETPNEVRNRLEKRDAKAWDENSYHSAILRDSDNIRRVAAMDVAIGQAKSLDDPDVRNLLIAIADWKIDPKGMDAIESNAYYPNLDDSSKSLIKGNYFYYTQGKFPSNLVPTKPPKMVDAETYRDRRKNRQ
ncbi:effector protein Tle3 domain-containing protein, partial [Burkholderia ubonensis]